MTQGPGRTWLARLLWCSALSMRSYGVMRTVIGFLSFIALAAGNAWAAGAGPSDAQIAAIVVAANQVDIDAGKLAESKSTSSQVKAFAQRMVTDHSGVLK